MSGGRKTKSSERPWPAVRVETGDWLELAGGLKGASVDFLYADPPFNTGLKRSTPPGASRRGRMVEAAYEDAWADGRAYARWLGERVAATRPAMKDTGVVAIHCDYRAEHHVRLMLEDLLGESCFVNHLIWRYGLGGSSPRHFARKHDDILVYSVKPGRHYFDPPMVPATSRRLAGQMKKATDVLDVPSLNNMALERTGYPTQKPLELLTMLVRAFSPEGGLVLDPCCGSGTTLVAAATEGRSAVGFDVSPDAVAVAKERLQGLEAARGR